MKVMSPFCSAGPSGLGLKVHCKAAFLARLKSKVLTVVLWSKSCVTWVTFPVRSTKIFKATLPPSFGFSEMFGPRINPLPAKRPSNAFPLKVPDPPSPGVLLGGPFPGVLLG